MNIWHDIALERIKEDDFIACIEISKGSKMKYELDIETGLLILDRVLYTSTHYPANYGFIPRTYSHDNDPLDVLVLCQEQIDPMSLVPCYPIGVIKMIDHNEVDEKIIAIAANDPSLNTHTDISDLPPHLANEISHFFSVYKQLEGKDTHVLETSGRKEANKVIRNSIERYEQKFANKIKK